MRNYVVAPTLYAYFFSPQESQIYTEEFESPALKQLNVK